MLAYQQYVVRPINKDVVLTAWHPCPLCGFKHRFVIKDITEVDVTMKLLHVTLNGMSCKEAFPFCTDQERSIITTGDCMRNIPMAKEA